jgi:hypothetical protein
MSKPHDIVAFREYTLSNGETRTESTRIGVAWPSQGTATTPSSWTSHPRPTSPTSRSW